MTDMIYVRQSDLDNDCSSGYWMRAVSDYDKQNFQLVRMAVLTPKREASEEMYEALKETNDILAELNMVSHLTSYPNAEDPESWNDADAFKQYTANCAILARAEGKDHE